MKYLKLFTNHSDYNTAKNSLDKPNVSYCEQQNEVHYNPWEDPRLIVTYYVENDNQKINLLCGDCEFLASNYFSKVEIDGVEISLSDLDETYCYYEFSQGIHIVKYTLLDQTTIPNFLFSDSECLINATIPNTIISIGEGAFYTTHLTHIEIPNTVTNIGNKAFAHDSYLTNITIPNTVINIGQNVFNYCFFTINNFINNSNLDEISNNYWGATIVDSDTNGFVVSGTTLLKYRGTGNNVIIPNNITTISNNSVFAEHNDIINVVIPDSVVTIGNNAFYRCSNLTNVTIGSGVTSINTQAFAYCNKLINITSLIITAPTIQNDTFRNIKTNGTLTVPNGSSGYNVWMGTGNYYLGLYNWTKVEQ